MQDLVDLENQYHASRTAPLVPETANARLSSEDLKRYVVQDASSEFDWDTGMEYIDLERSLDKRQRKYIHFNLHSL
jgi:hypothetical protein